MFKGALSFNRRSALSAFLCASTACASYIITRRKIPSGVQLAIACCLIAVECCSYPLVTANWQMLALGTLFGFTYGLIMGPKSAAPPCIPHPRCSPLRRRWVIR